jgi:hypothetical protein
MTTETSDAGAPVTGSADAGQLAEGANTRGGSSRTNRTGQRPRRGRGNNRGTRSNEAGPRDTKFTGRCDELKGEVYDCSSHSQVDGYTKTTKEIAEYVGRTYSAHVRTSVETLVLPTFTYPDDPAANASQTDKRKWQKKVDSMVAKEDRFEEDLKKVFSLIWGQCTEYLRAKLEAKEGYEQMKTDYNTIELLKSIKDCVFKFSDQKYATHSVRDAIQKFHNAHQEKNSNAQTYFQRFKNLIDVVEHCGGTLGDHHGLVVKKLEEWDLTYEAANSAERTVARSEVKEEFLACHFLLGADRRRYGKLIEDIENSHVQLNDEYPKTLIEAYNLLVHWKQDPKNSLGANDTNTSDGVAFANVGNDRGPPPDISEIQCYNCQEMGHYASTCSNAWRAQGSGTQALMSGGIEISDYPDDDISFNFANVTNRQTSDINYGSIHHQGAEVSKTWILLDNQSTVDVFCNPKLLKNVRRINKVMNIKCNAGVTRTDMIGDLPGYGQVWFNKNGIANILSLSKVEAKYRITYDSKHGKQFVVHKEDGTMRQFKQSDNGLFYMDAKELIEEEEDGTVLVNTVDENKKKYTNAAYKQAALARKLQNVIGRPSARAFLNIVDKNLLKDCPIVREDVLAAEDIFGPNLGSLKGKTVRQTGERVRAEYDEIPKGIMERYRDVTICVDLMYINKVPFLVTISRHLKFGTIEAVKNRRHKVLVPALKNVKRLYAM